MSRLEASSRLRSAVSFRSSFRSASGRLSSSRASARSICSVKEASCSSRAFRAAAWRGPGPESSAGSTQSSSRAPPAARIRPGTRRGISLGESFRRRSAASCRWAFASGESVAEASSRAVTARSCRPQASAARAAEKSVTGRSAFTRAPRTVPPAAANAAAGSLSRRGTKSVTASSSRAAVAPHRNPHAAPRHRRPRRRRRRNGARARRISFFIGISIRSFSGE